MMEDISEQELKVVRRALEVDAEDIERLPDSKKFQFSRLRDDIEV